MSQRDPVRACLRKTADAFAMSVAEVRAVLAPKIGPLPQQTRQSGQHMDEKTQESNDAPVVGTVFFDGASKGNPGRAGAGAVLVVGDTTVERAQYVGARQTNNYSEYAGLLLGMRAALEAGVTDLRVYGDSLLVINQMNGVWKIKHDNLKSMHRAAKGLAAKFQSVSFAHVRREHNARADRLASRAARQF